MALVHTVTQGPDSPLRRLRLNAGLSQERLARLADCSTDTFWLIEHGYRPSDEMLERLAAVLKCESTVLVP
jgi:transcriptional regulator with XRE-family HTH domain